MEAIGGLTEADEDWSFLQAGGWADGAKMAGCVGGVFGKMGCPSHRG
jgi:hypothetical protein